MNKPHITALCLTFGRIDFLNEAIQMFLDQTYDGPKELIVFNTFTKQTLVGNFPNVRIINAPERPSNLGACRNSAIRLANKGLIVIWDDDDAYLPNHLQNFADHFTEDEDVKWIWHSRQFYMEGYKLRQTVHGSCNSLAFTKTAWEQIGGYPERNSGEDRDFVSKLTANCPGKKVHLEDNQLSLLYHWGQGVYHLSGEGDDQKGMPSGHDRIGAHTEELAKRGVIPIGSIVLEPALRHDYVKMRDDFIAEREAIAQKKSSVCFVQLGRYGDIVNMLPMCLHCHNNYGKPYLMIAREFASILDGVSYVEPYVVDIPFDTLQPAIDLARQTFKHVIISQIWGRDYQCQHTTPAYNVESWKQSGLLHEFNNPLLLPLFDKDTERGQQVANKLGVTGKSVIVNLSKSFSSPFSHGQILIEKLRQALPEYSFIDVANMQLDRIYDLVPAICAARLVISIDTALLHLACATATEVFKIVNPVEWLGSVPRTANLVGAFDYSHTAANPDSLIEAVKKVISKPHLALNAVTRQPRKATVRQIFHAVQYSPSRGETIGRVKRAKASWEVLYKNCGVIPVHMTSYSASAKDIGDHRDLPYLKELLSLAMNRAPPEDIIMFSNDDNYLHPDLPDYLRYHVSVFGACASFRCEWDGQVKDSGGKGRYEVGSTHSAGQDVFAFTRAWLEEHWKEIPDFLLGASEWDWCLTMIIRKEKGIHTTQENIRHPIFPAEIPYGYVAHELHRPAWIHPDVVNASPAQQHNQKLFSEWLAANLPSFKMNQYPGTPPVRRGSNGKEVLTIRRSQALGDVLASTCVATALMDLGHDIEFQAHHSAHCILRRHPGLRVIKEPNSHCDIDLDGAYELHPQRRQKHFAEMFIERANAHLSKKGITIPSVTNYAPRIYSEANVAAECLPRLSKFQKPWVMICPRSQSWVNRTVPNEIWQEAAKQISGTKFWLGFNAAPGGIEDLFCRHVDHLIEYIGLSDLLLTVDSGPAHIAAAIGTPMVVIQQASSPALHFSDQRDWIMISPPLDCLNCQKDLCPINAKTPPCQKVNPKLIAETANARLRSVLTEDITAVISVFKPKLENLRNCLNALLTQVQEIVVVGDMDTPWPICRDLDDGKVKWVQKQAQKTGYGKKCNYGVRHANGKYIWFVNDDCFPQNDVAEKLRAVLNSDPKIAMVSHTLRYEDGTIQYAGKFRPPGHIGFGHLDHRGQKVRFNEPVEMESMCGASVLLRREAFYEVSGFDEDYYLYSDDDDLCMKLRKAGWKLIFEPRAEGIHIEHQSTGTMGNIAPLITESNAIFHRKWASYFQRNTDVTKLGTF